MNGQIERSEGAGDTDRWDTDRERERQQVSVLGPSTSEQPGTDSPLYFSLSGHVREPPGHKHTLCGALYACLQGYARSPALGGKLLPESRKALQIWTQPIVPVL